MYFAQYPQLSDPPVTYPCSTIPSSDKKKFMARRWKIQTSSILSGITSKRKQTLMMTFATSFHVTAQPLIEKRKHYLKNKNKRGSDIGLGQCLLMNCRIVAREIYFIRVLLLDYNVIFNKQQRKATIVKLVQTLIMGRGTGGGLAGVCSPSTFLERHCFITRNYPARRRIFPLF